MAQVEGALAREQPRVLERDDVRAHTVAPLLALLQPERREDAGRRGDENLSDPQLFGELAGVERSAPPKATSAKSRGSCPRSTETSRRGRVASPR